MAKFYKFMRLKNKVIRVIRFWSDNAKCSAQYGRLDNPEGRLTEGRIIEVLLYMDLDETCYTRLFHTALFEVKV